MGHICACILSLENTNCQGQGESSCTAFIRLSRLRSIRSQTLHTVNNSSAFFDYAVYVPRRLWLCIPWYRSWLDLWTMPWCRSCVVFSWKPIALYTLLALIKLQRQLVTQISSTLRDLTWCCGNRINCWLKQKCDSESQQWIFVQAFFFSF